MNTLILLIGHGLFIDGLTRIITERPDTEIIGAVNTWEAACAIDNKQQPDIIIVDHDKEELREVDLAPLLANQATDVKVIYLTLATNKMIIHNCQYYSDVSVPDLIHALQISRFERGAI